MKKRRIPRILVLMLLISLLLSSMVLAKENGRSIDLKEERTPVQEFLLNLGDFIKSNESLKVLAKTENKNSVESLSKEVLKEDSKKEERIQGVMKFLTVKYPEKDMKSLTERLINKEPNSEKEFRNFLNKALEDTKKVEVKKEESKLEEVPKEDIQPEEEKPGEVPEEDVKSEEERPGEVPEEDVKPGEEKPGEVPEKDIKPGEEKPDEVPEEDIKPGEEKPDEVPEEDIKPGEVPKEEIKSDEDLTENKEYLLAYTADGKKITTSINPDMVKTRSTGTSSGGFSYNYGSSATFSPHIKIDGKTAFCLDPYKTIPTGQTYNSGTVSSNSRFRNILHYGYPNSGTGDKAYLDTWMAIRFSSGSDGSEHPAWTDSSVQNLMKSTGAPTGTFDVQPRSQTATYNASKKRLETGLYRSSTDSSGSFTVYLPSGIGAVVNGSEKTGTFNVNSGTNFYLFADPTMNADVTIGISGSMTSKVVKIYSSSNSDLQRLITGEEPGARETNLNISVTFRPATGKATLKKTSTDSSITDNNHCYSLEGAEFTVYQNNSCTTPATDAGGSRAILKTDKNGNSNELEMLGGTYYVKETKAPKGYALDPGVKTITVTPAGSTQVAFADKPKLDPISMLLEKKDAETGLANPQGRGTLKGAQFTVKYYPDFYNSNPGVSVKPIRTWIFETDNNGYCSLNTTYQVGGDPLFLNSLGNASIPLGTITLQETKAPEGYHLNGEVFVRQITDNGGITENVHTYNTPIIPENALRLDLKKVQIGMPDKVIPGAIFEHTSPDGVKENFTTGANGMLAIKGLKWGRHQIKEIQTPEGYMLNGGIVTFDVARDNKISLVSNTAVDANGKISFTVNAGGDIVMEVEDALAPFKLQVHKENEKSLALKGAEFTLYSDASCTNEITKAITLNDGVLEMPNLKVGTTYYVKETKAPPGYRIPVNSDGSDIIWEIKVESIPVDDLFDFYVNGAKYTTGSTGAYTVTGNKADRIINMTVINHTTQKLPNTGSNGMLPLLLLGGGLMAVVLLIKNKNGEKNEK